MHPTIGDIADPDIGPSRAPRALRSNATQHRLRGRCGKGTFWRIGPRAMSNPGGNAPLQPSGAGLRGSRTPPGKVVAGGAPGNGPQHGRRAFQGRFRRGREGERSATGKRLTGEGAVQSGQLKVFCNSIHEWWPQSIRSSAIEPHQYNIFELPALRPWYTRYAAYP